MEKTLESKAKTSIANEEGTRREETLKLYKSNFEQREKDFIEEQRLLASIIYDLGVNNLINGKYKANGLEKK